MRLDNLLIPHLIRSESTVAFRSGAAPTRSRSFSSRYHGGRPSPADQAHDSHYRWRFRCLCRQLQRGLVRLPAGLRRSNPRDVAPPSAVQEITQFSLRDNGYLAERRVHRDVIAGLHRLCRYLLALERDGDSFLSLGDPEDASGPLTAPSEPGRGDLLAREDERARGLAPQLRGVGDGSNCVRDRGCLQRRGNRSRLRPLAPRLAALAGRDSGASARRPTTPCAWCATAECRFPGPGRLHPS